MFTVKCLEINSLTNQLYHPCGSDYTFAMYDLKTIKGVTQRLKNNYHFRKNIIALQICQGTINNNTVLLTINDLSEYTKMNF